MNQLPDLKINLQNAPSGPPYQAAPTSNADEEPYPAPQQPEILPRRTLTISGVIALIAIIGIIYLLYIYHNAPRPLVFHPMPPSSGQSNTSIYKVPRCAIIDSPGVYQITSNIQTFITNGTCITIKSSNVYLSGNNHNITGSGPYVKTAPFSYGISVENATNVTVSNISVLRFSYDIYLGTTIDSKVINATALNGTVSGIYLFDSTNDLVKNSKAFGAASQKGGVGIWGGSDNKIFNNLITNNVYYGLSINSTGNKFINNTIASNPVDLYCGSNANFSNSNNFSGSRCAINQYCNFAQCSSSNQPSSISSVVLSKAVQTCGVIDSPGTYTLASNLSLSSYLNTSNPLSKHSACIQINSPNVRLYCNNAVIRNAWYGVLASGVYNTIIQNCNLYNDTYGIYLSGSFNGKITGGKATDNKYALYVNNETNATVVNVTYYGNTYGIYLNGSSGSTFNRINTRNNTYGVFVYNDSVDSFRNSSFSSSKTADFYCSIGSYNYSYNIFLNNVCGVSDCNWASCTTHIQPPLPSFPIYTCGNIATPGSYTIESTLLSNGVNCITIKTGNVNLNCNNEKISGVGLGIAFLVNGYTNVTISNCNIDEFGSGISALNANYLKISNIGIQNVSKGVLVTNSTYIQVLGINASSYSSYGYSFNNINNSVIENDTATHGFYNASGFIFVRSYNNLINHNNAFFNPFYGFVFNNSRSDVIANNSAFSNTGFDYKCGGGSTGLFSEEGLVNSGVSKSGCIWMIELNPLNTQVCYAVSTSTEITLQQDMLYTYGRTCYTVFDSNTTKADDSVINCNGHTVLATNGGVFFNASDTINPEIENCYLIGFPTAVVSTATQTTVFNNTIVGSNYAIYFNNTSYPMVLDNFITNSSYALYMNGTGFGTIENNVFTKDNQSIYVQGGSGSKITNNSATSTRIGLYLGNTQLNILQNNLFINTGQYGIQCVLYATNKSSNTDQGGNVCSTNRMCAWMTNSPKCAPS